MLDEDCVAVVRTALLHHQLHHLLVAAPEVQEDDIETSDSDGQADSLVGTEDDDVASDDEQVWHHVGSHQQHQDKGPVSGDVAHVVQGATHQVALIRIEKG